jgi:hypothetical protein
MIIDNGADLKVNQHGLSCPSDEDCASRCSGYLDPNHKKTINVLKDEGYL